MKMLDSPLRWHGGKSLLRAKHIAEFPKKYERFVDACCGALWTLLGLPPHEGVSEYANDVDYFLWNFWACLREDTLNAELMYRLSTTPFSQRQFQRANEMLKKFGGSTLLSKESSVPLAVWYFIVACQSRQGLGKSFATPTRRTRRGMNEQVSAWLSRVDGLTEVVERLRRVELRNQDLLELINELDWKKTFFYIDPPYLQETRVVKQSYQHEMSEEYHEQLLTRLLKLKGKFMLCGYPSKLYNRFAKQANWRRIKIQSTKHSSSAKTKPVATECIWMNY